MPTKRQILIVTVAACAAALAAPLALAGGSTDGEPQPSATIVYIDPAPRWRRVPATPKQVESPPQVSTRRSRQPRTSRRSRSPSRPCPHPRKRSPTHPMCGGYLVKGDDIPPPATDDAAADEPDPEAGATTATDETSGDDLTDATDGATEEPAADDDALGDGAEADGLSGEEPPDLEAGVITEEPAETIEDGAELAG